MQAFVPGVFSIEPFNIFFRSRIILEARLKFAAPPSAVKAEFRAGGTRGSLPGPQDWRQTFGFPERELAAALVKIVAACRTHRYVAVREMGFARGDTTTRAMIGSGWFTL